MANSEFVGKKLNVETKKGVHQETVVRQLSTKGIVRTEEGNEYNIADLRKKGRGIFVTAMGGAKPKSGAVPKTPVAENTRKPAERPAPNAVTADELEGKNCVAEGENGLRDDYYSGLFLVDGEEEHDYFFAVKLSNIQFLED